MVELEVSLVTPKDIARLYFYWNELIKIVKYYFSNVDLDEEELNNLYFDLIDSIEKLLEQGHCGSDLRRRYNKPFRHLGGAEFELKKNDRSREDALGDLYDYFGQAIKMNGDLCTIQ
jgi:hypothetical protein